MEITILGNNSAIPAYGRHPTAQLLQTEGQRILIDCGEGTQMQMQKYHIRRRNLDHILISHLHGDHYFGLPGLLNSMSLSNRTAPLHLFAPKGLYAILENIWQAANTNLHFELHFHPLEDGHHLIHTHPHFDIYSFNTEHRIACYGFSVHSKVQKRSLNVVACQQRKVPVTQYRLLVEGKDALDEYGNLIPNVELTHDSKPSRSYAYCADTISTFNFLPAVNNVNTIYHESTFLQADAAKAQLRFHSTAQEAALLALRAGAEQLLLGHFSSRYENLQDFETEAQAIFPNSTVTREGQTYLI